MIDIDVTSLLPRIDLPVLYLCAKEDCIVPQSAQRYLEGFLPQMQAAALASPHMLLQTAPLEAWHAVGPFLNANRNGNGRRG